MLINYSNYFLIYHPKSSSKQALLYIPGINFDSQQIDRLIQVATQEGYHLFILQFPYHLGKDTFTDRNLSEEQNFYSEALAWLYKQFPHFSYHLIAKSFWAVKVFLTPQDWIKSYSFIAPAIFFAEIDNLEQIQNTKYGNIGQIDEILLPNNILHHWTAPTLLIHGNQDQTISIHNSEKILNQLTSDTQWIEIAGMGHSDTTHYHQEIWQQLSDFLENNQ